MPERLAYPSTLGRRRARSAPVRATFLAAALAGFVVTAGSAPAEAAAHGCGRLPVKAQVLSKFGERYALQYTDKVPVYVQTRGPTIRNWQIQIYTFDGFRLGRSKRLADFSVGAKGRAKLKYPMQAGKYTLVVKGTVAGCGELERTKVIKFRDCRDSLPLKFPERPGGSAADYGAYLSVKVQTRGPVVRNLVGRVYSFDGRFFGKSRLGVLFGTAFMSNRLRRPLQTGGYSFLVEGRIDQPRECGDKSKTAILKFK